MLRNADGYHARPTGPLRPRWLAKLRGLRCVSAAWIAIPPHLQPHRPVILLGTAFGALFSLSIDDALERDDVLSRLWVAPTGHRVDGVRVEHVAGKFVATVATTSALYLFSNAVSLPELFTDKHTVVISRDSQPQSLSAKPVPEPSDPTPLPSDLQFMTGSSGQASRRFVWAGSAGITHAQLSVRRQKSKASNGVESPRASSRSTVIASVIEKDIISWARLKQTSGSAVPLACNLSAFHVLVLYPASVFAYNQISGQLTQLITVWSPDRRTNARSRAVSENSAERSGDGTRMGRGESSLAAIGDRPRRGTTSWEDAADFPGGDLLSSPAAGFARDVLTDVLWVYTEDGEFSRMVASDEEQMEAWKAAKAMGRFGLAMALAPLVSGGMADDTAMFQTREAVLEAQADHAASRGDWDIAAQLYAKTNRPIESVLLDIVEAYSETQLETRSSANDLNLRSLGIGSRLVMTRHMITYLVRKLDKMESSRAMQRTIIATMLVQMYASQLSGETDEVLRAEVRKDFGHFLADRYKDLDMNTAVAVLNKNGCEEEAWKLAVLSGNVILAATLSSRRGEIEQTLSLLKEPVVTEDAEKMSLLIGTLCNQLLHQAPQKVSSGIAWALKKGPYTNDHITVVQGLARVARGKKEAQSKEAYQAVTGYLFDLLQDWNARNARTDTNDTNKNSPSSWHNLIAFLFQLHAEFGTESEAQRSYDHLVGPRLVHDKSPATREALGTILCSATSAGFQRLCVVLYQGLGLHEAGVQLAAQIDVKLAEAKVELLGQTDLPENVKHGLWCVVASKSEDAIGVVERSKGVLHVEDVLTGMGAFDSATERVKAAVEGALREHQRRAGVAKSDAVAALEVCDRLREDVEKARAWQKEKAGKIPGGRGGWFACGHEVTGEEDSMLGKMECEFCSGAAVDSIDKPFDTGCELPLTRLADPEPN